jgi:predicted nucleotidyltransferase
VESVKSFSCYFLSESEANSFYQDELNPKFWTRKISKDGTKEKWVLDPIIRKKLLKIGEEFYQKLEDIVGKAPIYDIQLTGSLANYNWTEFSDLDVHVLVEFDKIDAPRKVINAAGEGAKFIWNSRHDIKMRGHDVEVFLQDSDERSHITGLFSLKDNKWIKSPKFNPPDVDESEVIKKTESLKTEISSLEDKLIKSLTLPKDARNLFNRAKSLKKKISKMRKEGLEKNGEFSIGNLAFKRLRNEGYIGKLIDIMSQAYDRIYEE